MRTEQPIVVRLEDYRPPAFLIEEAHLTFRLEPEATRVRAELTMTRTAAPGEPLRLNAERMHILSVEIDGAPAQWSADDAFLTVQGAPDAFTLTTEVEIDPKGNAALEGLYMSGGRFCSQCEAEGFRKITPFLDRPDVLTRYTVRIEADRAYPHLLSNGNLVEQGELEGGRHFAVWTDPFPKPCYLFALVAGQLDVLEDSLTTMSGRTVALRIYVDPGQSARAAYAMDALKRAMRWDEQAFGREYDLDLFMIVAVRDFNFGAMENKGLNIFNSSLLLADPETATDFDYERIESVVAHEYFHNWTGNRITCRDWFQLCLKEGLTVFRDQEFSADQRSRAVQRIKDVRALRARQFAEDAGPLAHPVRPSSYQKIDNFYTATVYEKGAEVVRMLKTLLGDEAFRAGMDLWFGRCDGTASTVEAFVGCFAEASGRDLSDFFAWYEQAGTPRVNIEAVWDEGARALDLRLSQRTEPTPGQPEKRPLPIPIRLGLLAFDGEPMPVGNEPERLIVLDGPETRLRIEGVERLPVLSALRGFSAPVTLETDEPPHDAYVRLAADSDLFNRWEAGQRLATALILRRAYELPDEVNEERYAEALGRALADEAAEPAFKALLLALPSEGDLAQARAPVDPAALHEARDALRARIAVHLRGDLAALHTALQEPGEFSASAEAAGRRALRNAALDMLTAAPDSDVRLRAEGHYEAAANMTDMMAGLSALMSLGGPAFDVALAGFYTRFENEPLVIDKWFALQARSPLDDALERVQALTAHPAFDARNPNRLRSLIGGFSQGNPARFHAPDGSGHRFLAEQILAIDAFNPMTAARLLEPLGGWRRYAPQLAASMKVALSRIAAHDSLSRNVNELATRALEG